MAGVWLAASKRHVSMSKTTLILIVWMESSQEGEWYLAP